MPIQGPDAAIHQPECWDKHCLLNQVNHSFDTYICMEDDKYWETFPEVERLVFNILIYVYYLASIAERYIAVEQEGVPQRSISQGTHE